MQDSGHSAVCGAGLPRHPSRLRLIPRTIRGKLVVYYSILFALVIAGFAVIRLWGIPFTPCKGQKGLRREEALRHLNETANLEKERLLRWIEERRGDVRVCAGALTVEGSVFDLLARVPGEEARAAIRGKGAAWYGSADYRTVLEFLRRTKEACAACRAIEILDARTGIVVASTDPSRVGMKEKEDDPLLRQALMSTDVVVGKAETGPDGGASRFRLARALSRGKPPPTGVLTMTVDCEEAIKSTLLAAVGGENRTAALLLDEESRPLVALNGGGGAGAVSDPRKRRPLTNRAAVLAAAGKEGSVETKDHRGVPVLAVLRFLPLTPQHGWGLVIQQDLADIYAPLRQDIVGTFALGSVAVLCVVIVGSVLATNLSRPIRRLVRDSRSVVRGDLSIRTAVEGSEETVGLALAFNALIGRFQHWHDELEQEVTARTEELIRTNRALEGQIAERRRGEAELRKLNTELDQRVNERTAELRQRMEDAERLNRAMLNLADDLQAAIRELELTSRQLNEANRELESFSYSVSHDLRAPLRHMQGFVILLQKEIEASAGERGRRYMQIIAESTRRMEHLIDDLLALSRLGRTAMTKSRFRLDELARKTAADLEENEQSRIIQWEIEDMPEVTADRSLLRLVLTNLLGNALKYTRTRQRARIRMGCLAGDEHELCFFVQDNGVGFDMKYADRLFRVFQRLHSLDQFEGTGVGLANVQRIIRRHDGRVWAEGEVDKGATFYFSLPTNPSAAHPRSPEALLPRESTGGATAAHRKDTACRERVG